jgi:hypothetical protein
MRSISFTSLSFAEEIDGHDKGISAIRPAISTINRFLFITTASF